jgi:hypothetical protein
VAFAETKDVKNLIFVTSRNTSKYQNLMKDTRVSLLIDNRINSLADFGSAIVVTAIGKSAELNSDSQEPLRVTFLRKHPNLVDFVDNDKSSLFLVRVNTYVMAGFEEVERVDFKPLNETTDLKPTMPLHKYCKRQPRMAANGYNLVPIHHFQSREVFFQY